MDESQKKLHEAEEELRRLREQLKEAGRELEMLSYSISHDLRAPLRAIKGFSEALMEDYKDRIDAEGQRYLGIITTSTNQVYALIDGILNFSRLGRQEMHPSDVNVTDLVRGLFAEFQAKHPNRKLDCRVQALPNAHCDLVLSRHLWSNLVDNAIKFTGPRETAVIEVGGKDEPNELVYFIKDNGVGFDMKYTEKLFGVFQRFHTEKEFPGVGVGLAIAQRIVRRHGGRIWADAKLNEGTTIHFSLPKDRKA
jgi:light-regulated signal transduction histidine kinase (bacteriophytochrome)